MNTPIKQHRCRLGAGSLALATLALASAAALADEPTAAETDGTTIWRDCGAYALQLTARLHGNTESAWHVQSSPGSRLSSRYRSVEELLTSMRESWPESASLALSLDDLPEVGFPCVAYLDPPNMEVGHFLLVCDSNDQTLLIAEEGRKPRWVPRQGFEPYFRGMVMTFEPPPTVGPKLRDGAIGAAAGILLGLLATWGLGYRRRQTMSGVAAVALGALSLTSCGGDGTPIDSVHIVGKSAVNLGQLPWNAARKHDVSFVVKNSTNAPVRIDHIKTTCGCADASIDRRTIGTGETATLVAHMNLAQGAPTSSYVTLHFSDGTPPLSAHISAHKEAPILISMEDEERPLVVEPWTQGAAQSSTRTLILNFPYDGEPPFDSLRVKSVSWTDGRLNVAADPIRVLENGKSARVTLRFERTGEEIEQSGPGALEVLLELSGQEISFRREMRVLVDRGFSCTLEALGRGSTGSEDGMSPQFVFKDGAMPDDFEVLSKPSYVADVKVSLNPADATARLKMSYASDPGRSQGAGVEVLVVGSRSRKWQRIALPVRR